MHSQREHTCTLVMATVVKDLAMSTAMADNVGTHRLDDRLTLKTLTILKTKQSTIHIIKTLAPKWKEFGVLLEFDGHGDHLDVLEEQYGKPVACCQAMMKDWIKGKGVQPASWRNLIGLLRDHDMIVLADTLQKELSRKWQQKTNNYLVIFTANEVHLITFTLPVENHYNTPNFNILSCSIRLLISSLHNIFFLLGWFTSWLHVSYT